MSLSNFLHVYQNNNKKMLLVTVYLWHYGLDHRLILQINNWNSGNPTLIQICELQTCSPANAQLLIDAGQTKVIKSENFSHSKTRTGT